MPVGSSAHQTQYKAPGEEQTVVQGKMAPMPLFPPWQAIRALGGLLVPGMVSSEAGVPRYVRGEGSYPGGEVLAQLGNAQLRGMRQEEGANQELLGPYEHRAFVREWVADPGLSVAGVGIPNAVGRPLAALSMAGAIPAYTGLKAAGLYPRTRSSASVREVGQGYAGIWEALKGMSQ